MVKPSLSGLLRGAAQQRCELQPTEEAALIWIQSCAHQPTDWHLHNFSKMPLFLQQSGTSATTSPGSGRDASPAITSNNTTCWLRKGQALDNVHFALTLGPLQRQRSVAVNNLWTLESAWEASPRSAPHLLCDLGQVPYTFSFLTCELRITLVCIPWSCRET